MTPSTARRAACIGLAATWLTGCVGLTVAGGERWWVYVAREASPMTWLQSVVLVVASTWCLLLAAMLRLVPVGAGTARGASRRALPWLVLGVGLAGLALDERFALHERLRDRVLAPAGVRVPFLPWVAAGDFVLLGVALVGLALLVPLLRAVRSDRAATAALLLGVVLSAVTVLADTVDPERMGPGTERLEQSLEEMAELAAGLCLLAVPLLRILGFVAGLAVVGPARAPHEARQPDDPQPVAPGGPAAEASG